jgi:hypothetical protein
VELINMELINVELINVELLLWPMLSDIRKSFVLFLRYKNFAFHSTGKISILLVE